MVNNKIEILNLPYQSKTEFYTKYLPVVKLVIRNILFNAGTEQDIEECANDTLYEIIQKSHKFDHARGSIGNYVRLVARSRALTLRKKLVNCSSIPLDETILVENTNDQYLGDIISNIVSSLKSADKRLFTLKFVYYYPTEQIAKQLGISRNSADVRINRLRKKLKTLLKEQGISIREA